MRINPTATLLLVLLTSLLCYSVSYFVVSHYLNIISTVLLAAVCFYWLFFLNALWVYFIYVFAAMFTALSGFSIEYFNLYMFEVRYSGELTGASAITSSLMSVFLSLCFLFANLSKKLKFEIVRIRYLDNLALLVFLLVGVSLVIYMLAVVGLYGSPLFMGIDRFSFWSEITPAGTAKARYFLILSSFFVACANTFGMIRFSNAVFWLVAALTALILHGEKMSGLILVLYFFIIPYFTLNMIRISPLRMFLFFTGAVTVFIIIVLGNYLLIRGNLSSAFELFLARISIQGQMNYAIMNNIAGEATLSSIFQGFMGFGAEMYEAGIYYFMNLIAPTDIVERRLQQGTTFTAPFPANIIYFFGPMISLVIVLILAVIMWFLSSFLLCSLRSKNFMSSLVAIGMWYYTYGVIMMGNTYKLFEWKVMLMVFTIFILLAIRSNAYVLEKCSVNKVTLHKGL